MINPDHLKMPEKGIPKMDLIFAIILLIATLSTAFCVYQATRWNGFQAIDFGDASKLRTESVRASNAGNSSKLQMYRFSSTGWMRKAKMIVFRQNSFRTDSGMSSSLLLMPGLPWRIKQTRFPQEHLLSA